MKAYLNTFAEKKYCQKYLPIFILFLIFIASISIRLAIHLKYDLTIGIGIYYPLSIQTILQKGKMAFQDFPFVFYFEALINKIILLFDGTASKDILINSFKFFDSFIPSFALIPAFLIVKNWEKNKHFSIWPYITALIFIFFPGYLFLISNLHKNSIGIIFMLFYFYSFQQLFFFQKHKKKYIIYSISAFILISLTHFGCLMISMVFTAIFLLTYFFIHIKEDWKPKLKFILLFFLLLLLAFGLTYVFDSNRARSLIKLIASPLLLFNLSEVKNILIDFDNINIFRDLVILNLIIVYLLLIVFSIFFIRSRDKIDKHKKCFILSSIITSLFLSFPFLASGYAARFWSMAYIPLIFCFGFIFNDFNNKEVKIILSLFLIMLVLYSAFYRLTGSKDSINYQPYITKTEYNELENISKDLLLSKGTLVITSRDLQYWTAFIMETNIANISVINEDLWTKYKKILFLTRKDIKSDYFEEIIIPENAKKTVTGNFFIFYNSEKIPEKKYFELIDKFY